MILEAEQLSVGYGDRVVGRGLAVALARGEVLALLGPNGGGKTTLLKTLLGLLAPIAGDVRLEGRALGSYPIGERARRLAYVPQVHAGTFAFTVEDVVLMGRSAHAGLFTGPSRRDREIAARTIARLGLGTLATRPYTAISGGERQLVLIARALAQEPMVVVFDEPTASLDFGNQGRVMREMRGLAAAGLGVVFSTHDPNQALRFADRVLLIRDGGMLASGPVAETLTLERLRELYATEIAIVRAGAEIAFLPG